MKTMQMAIYILASGISFIPHITIAQSDSLASPNPSTLTLKQNSTSSRWQGLFRAKRGCKPNFASAIGQIGNRFHKDMTGPINLEPGKEIYLRMITDGGNLNALSNGPGQCISIVSFTPEAGHNYSITHYYYPNGGLSTHASVSINNSSQCSISIADNSDESVPSTIKIHHLKYSNFLGTYCDL